MGLLGEGMDILSKIAKLPGNMLNTVADILPHDESHSDMQTWCEAKGGVMENGKCILTQTHEIDSETHNAMFNGISSTGPRQPYSGYSESLTKE